MGRGTCGTPGMATMNVIQVGSDQTPPGVVVTERENSMAGKVEPYKDAKGKFRFRLKAGNGEIIAARRTAFARGRKKPRTPRGGTLPGSRSLPRRKPIYQAPH